MISKFEDEQMDLVSANIYYSKKNNCEESAVIWALAMTSH